MVSLGSGYFDPDSPLSSFQGGIGGGRAASTASLSSSLGQQQQQQQQQYFPIFKYTTPAVKKNALDSRTGSEADDEATTTVSAPSSSSSSDPSRKAQQAKPPPVQIVNSRNKTEEAESSSTTYSGGETSSLSTHTPSSTPIVLPDREHFPIFTDEDDCTSIGESRVGESFSSTTTTSSPIPWSDIMLTPTKNTPSLPTYKKHSSSMSHEERGRQLAKVLLDKARSKQAVSKKRRVSFARNVRINCDAVSSASTSSSSSSVGEHNNNNNNNNKSNHLPPEQRPASRHVLSKRTRVRASLLRRAVQSLRRRKDFVDKLFEIPSENDEVEEKQDDVPESQQFPAISAVTARNKNFAEWEKRLRVSEVSPTSKWTRPSCWGSGRLLPPSPLRPKCVSSPQPSPSRISVTSTASLSAEKACTHIPFFNKTLSMVKGTMPPLQHTDSKETKELSSANKTDDDEGEDNTDSCWTNDGLSGRMDRDAMLAQLGFLPRDQQRKNTTNQEDPSTSNQLSREAVLKTLETLGSLWEKEEEMEAQEGRPSSSSSSSSSPPLPTIPPRSPPRHVQKEFGATPTVSILGVVLVNYPQMVCDQVNYFRRHVLKISDAYWWGGGGGGRATGTATLTTSVAAQSSRRM